MNETILKGSLASIVKWGKLDHSYDVPDRLIPLLEDFLGDLSKPCEKLADLKDISFTVPDPKLKPENLESLRKIVGEHNVSLSDYDRVRLSCGYSYYDVIRLRLGKISNFPDVVVYPDSHDEVQEILLYAHEKEISVVPVGGKTGVTEASETKHGGIALDLAQRMNRIIEVDEKSLILRCQVGIKLPDLESYLNEKGFMLGHFPQSFESSTLGGSIATRGAGQQSTKYGKIEDMVFGLRLATPVGEKTTVELPASAMGPDLIKVIAGSEGTLGVITEAIMKIHSFLPETRAFSSFLFKDFASGLGAIREIMQYGVTPATIRLSDTEETHILTQLETTGKKEQSFFSKAAEGIAKKYLKRKGYMEGPCLCILEFEGENEIVKLTRSKTHQISKKWQGFYLGKRPAKEWYANRFELPYLRDNLMDQGILVDTLETAAPWSRIERLHESVRAVLRKHTPIIMTHCSHCYREGASLYFTYLAKRKKGSGYAIQQIIDIQNDVLAVLEEENCALSHHHGIGRAFKKWFAKHAEAEVIIALKRIWDPKNIMNTGNLVDLTD
ncbi:MAG: FAD-binding oxidoreductase [Candidatus Hodarchaeales archaeon]|jgi:alkyldihydroxyacetonephosphate synthase